MYALIFFRLSFVPVTVLREEGGKAYITSIRTGYLTDGMTVRLF